MKNYLGIMDYLLDVSKNNVLGDSIVNKFATNPEVTTSSNPETIWSAGGVYDFFPSSVQNMEAVSTDINDTGALRTSGTATGGSFTTLEDNDADFVADGVVVGDLFINDCNDEYAVVVSVSEKVITHLIMTNGSQVRPRFTENVSEDSYRIVHANGTGAAAIVVFGLDSNYVFQSEIIILNGTTPVSLAKQYIRQHRAFVLIADTRAGALGHIVVRIAPGGTVACYIMQGANQTQQAIFTIPDNTFGNFLQGYVSSGKGAGATAISARFTWTVTPFGCTKNINGEIELVNTGPGYWKYKYAGAPLILPRTDIEMTCEEVSNTVGVQAGMDILLSDISV